MLENVTRLIRRGAVVAAEPIEPDDHVRRPTVGLALSGGSARGWAHIGVLRALDEAGIEVDVVAGTSIGAVVGACWADGRLDAIEDFARSITRRRMLSMLDFTPTGSGLIGGERLGRMLREQIGERRIEEMAKPFTAIATEIGTGHEVWLSKGRLVDALRASYALPGIFQPVRIGGSWLLDGALVNPLPVNVCRAKGAQIVIAVNLGFDNLNRGAIVRHNFDPEGVDGAGPEGAVATGKAGLRTRGLLRRQIAAPPRDGLPGIPGVMIDAFNIIQDRITRARLAADPPDFAISPRMGKIGLFDFHRAGEAIALGHEAGRRAVADALRDLVTG